MPYPPLRHRRGRKWVINAIRFLYCHTSYIPLQIVTYFVHLFSFISLKQSGMSLSHLNYRGLLKVFVIVFFKVSYSHFLSDMASIKIMQSMQLTIYTLTTAFSYIYTWWQPLMAENNAAFSIKTNITFIIKIDVLIALSLLSNVQTTIGCLLLNFISQMWHLCPIQCKSSYMKGITPSCAGAGMGI